MNNWKPRAFTVIELLVVVSIIALLVGILLPAIGRARDQARLSQSQSNLRQLATAVVTYSAEWNDRQPTVIDDQLSVYADGGDFDSIATAFQNYEDSIGAVHPIIYLGASTRDGGVYGASGRFNPEWFVPIRMTRVVQGGGFGAFRLILQASIINSYLGGKWYDEILFAPKDSAVISAIEEKGGFDDPSEFGYDSNNPFLYWTSYCYSPAAMYNPIVLSWKRNTEEYYNDPWLIPTGFKSPTLSQATYAGLKSMILEHHWLQGRQLECHPSFSVRSTYDGCEPYYFNHSLKSAPVTAFFDGHVGQIGSLQAAKDTLRVAKQNEEVENRTNHGLWSFDTDMGGAQGEYPELYVQPVGGGYYQAYAYDWISTSFHILTLEGIKGRDILPK